MNRPKFEVMYFEKDILSNSPGCQSECNEQCEVYECTLECGTFCDSECASSADY